jgi:hypothetical protein
MRCTTKIKQLNTHSNDFHSALGHENGYSNVYYKTATMLYNLQYTLGDSLFLNSMKYYVSKWKFAHPYFEDFRQSIIEYTHQDLNWFFDQWMETTKSTDYGIYSIKKGIQNDQFKIKLKRYGQMQMPIDFRVTAKNGQQYDFHIPNTVFVKKTKGVVLPKWYGWDLLNPTYTAKVTIPSGVKLVQLDPSNRLADVDMMDNYKRPLQLVAPESRTVKFENYISNFPNWKKYTAFVRPDIWWNAIDGIKLGAHVDGSYLNYLRNLYCTVWFNSRTLSQEAYRPYEGESWWKNTSPIDYTLRYDNVLKKYSPKILWGVDSRYIDGFFRNNIYGAYKLTDTKLFKVEATSFYRKREGNRDYLLFPAEWSSFRKAGSLNTKTNSFLQLSLSDSYGFNRGNGHYAITLRMPFTYSYSYIQGESINNLYWKKFEIKTRAFARFGMGDDIPTESALYLQGANPEEMMESKWVRSQGIAPRSLSGFATDNFSNIQQSGGLNLRGYTGYYAVDADANGTIFINYKGRSGAAVNVEIDFDKYFKIRPKVLRDYLHIDAYIFGDAGVISRGTYNANSITTLQPVKQWSKIRMDAGIGTAFTIKKFGPFEKIHPFTIRFDMPLLLSSPPFAKPDFFAWRWVIGVGRSF